MNTKVLIDAFVRQTTVLVAQVATSSGMRTPLSHVANQVFLDLTQALEEQGLGRKVVADMFGLALRSYQQKVDRLTESASTGGITLWEAIHRFIAERDVVGRAELLRRFAKDDAASVASILLDLVESGLVYKTGRGDQAVYRITPEADLMHALERDQQPTIEACVWTVIYRQGPLTRDQVLSALPVQPAQLEAALVTLLADARIERSEDGAYSSTRMLLPLDVAAGWEAGLLDHYHAVVGAILAKLRNGQTRALPDDELGGSTFSFDVWPGHPHEAAARALLKKQRDALAALWNEVVEHNKAGKPKSYTRVTFYCGQRLAEEGPDPGAHKEKTDA
jgi:hypothetical protein